MHYCYRPFQGTCTDEESFESPEHRPEFWERHGSVKIKLRTNILSRHLASAFPTAHGYLHMSRERRLGSRTERWRKIRPVSEHSICYETLCFCIICINVSVMTWSNIHTQKSYVTLWTFGFSSVHDPVRRRVVVRKINRKWITQLSPTWWQRRFPERV